MREEVLMLKGVGREVGVMFTRLDDWMREVNFFASQEDK